MSISPINQSAFPADPARRASQGANNESPLRNIVNGVFQALSTPDFYGPSNISQTDSDNKPLRYDLPKISMIEYMASVGDISGLYIETGVTVVAHDKAVGCYAELRLHKFRAQSEYDYEELLKTLELTERHALHTTEQMSIWEKAHRQMNPEGYLRDLQKRKQLQLEGLQKAVEAWKKTNLFVDVFIPTPQLRMEIGEYPECIACNDTIIFKHKPLPPEERIPGTFQKVIVLDPTLHRANKEARIFYDLAAQSSVQRIWNRFSGALLPAPRSSSRPAERAVIEEIADSSEAPQPPVPRRPENLEGARESFFFRAWRRVFDIFAAIFGFFFSFCRRGS